MGPALARCVGDVERFLDERGVGRFVVFAGEELGFWSCSAQQRIDLKWSEERDEWVRPRDGVPPPPVEIELEASEPHHDC